MIQLLVVATGIAAALWIWNQMVKRGISKGVALVVVLPIIILFVVIAFFKVSDRQKHNMINFSTLPINSS
jgi:ABC-type transport system involved in cytochrome bd biosynthesis fused ATPase/permease subunit